MTSRKKRPTRKNRKRRHAIEDTTPSSEKNKGKKEKEGKKTEKENKKIQKHLRKIQVELYNSPVIQT